MGFKGLILRGTHLYKCVIALDKQNSGFNRLRDLFVFFAQNLFTKYIISNTITSIKVKIKKKMNKGYLTKEWSDFRLKIFKRDNFKCIKCKSNENLQCHHTYYVVGWKLWEYPDNSMETLCSKCHTNFHNKKKGGSMFISPKKAQLLKDKFNKVDDNSYKIKLSHIEILRMRYEVQKMSDFSGVKKKNLKIIKERLNLYKKILQYNESLN